MNNINLRIISKIGLLFVVIGFFLPISCNLNGFEIAKSAETYGGPTILSISLYSIFIFSCIGIILLFALLMKYKFSIGYDWADLIIIITAFLVFMVIQLQSSDDPLVAIFSRLQSGAYIIFIGLTVSLFTLLSVPFETKKTVKVHNNEIEKVDVEEKRTLERVTRRLHRREILFFIESFGNYLLLIFCIVLWLFLSFLIYEFSSHYILGYLSNFIEILYIIFVVFLLPFIITMIITTYLIRTILFFILNKKTYNYWRKRPNWYEFGYKHKNSIIGAVIVCIVIFIVLVICFIYLTLKGDLT